MSEVLAYVALLLPDLRDARDGDEEQLMMQRQLTMHLLGVYHAASYVHLNECVLDVSHYFLYDVISSMIRCERSSNVSLCANHQENPHWLRRSM